MDVYVINGDNPQNNKQILYIPGGGYVIHPIAFHWSFLEKIANETGMTITVPIYPKAPNYTYKDVFDKVFPLYEEILTRTSSDEIIFMGDSAGAGLALALAQLAQEKGLAQPGNIVLMSP